jgi:hydrogenase expression/formation protein HypC
MTAACRSAKRPLALPACSKADRTPKKEPTMCLGIPGCIVKIDDTDNMFATVDICGVRRQINISCIVDDAHAVEACVGDWVLVHVGFAMSRIDASEAAETLRVLNELGAAQVELDSIRAANDDFAPEYETDHERRQ